MNDIERTWIRVNEAYNLSIKRSKVLAFEVKILLCRTSILTLWSKFEPSLLAKLVECDLYTATQAMTIIKLLFDEQQQAEALILLVGYLPKELVNEAIQIVYQMKNRTLQLESISKLIPLLTEPVRLSIIQHTLTIIQQTTEEISCATALVALAPYLPIALCREAIFITSKFKSAYLRAKTLPPLMQSLSSEDSNLLRKEVLAVTRNLNHVPNRAEVYISLLRYLPKSENYKIALEALGVVQRIRNWFLLAEKLGELVSFLPEQERHKASGMALMAVRGIKDESFRALTLSRLIPNIPKKHRVRALAIAHEIQSLDARLLALSAIFDHLPEPLRRQTLSEILIQARTVKLHQYRVHIFCIILPNLTGKTRELIITRAIRSAYGIDDLSQRTTSLVALAPYLSATSHENILMEVLSGIKIIGDVEQQTLIANVLIPCFSNKPLNCTLSNLFIDKTYHESFTSIRASHHKNNEIIEEILKSTNLSSNDAIYQAKTWITIAPFMSEPKRTELILEVFAAVRKVENDLDRSYLFTELASRLAAWASYSPRQAHLALRELLEELSYYLRPNFLNDLAALVPVILTLAGDEGDQAAEGIYQAIQEVCEWWP